MYKEKARKFMEDDLAVKGENHFVKEVYRGNMTDPKESLIGIEIFIIKKEQIPKEGLWLEQ